MNNKDFHKLPDFKVEFPNKDNLLSENQIDNLLIAKIENCISEDDDKYISQKIHSDKEIENKYIAYNKTKLVPNKNIKYPNKNKLYSKSNVLKYVISVAAVILLFMVSGIFINYNFSNKNNNSELIAVSPLTEKEKENKFVEFPENTDTVVIEEEKNKTIYTANNNLISNIEKKSSAVKEDTITNELQAENKQYENDNTININDIAQIENFTSYTVEYIRTPTSPKTETNRLTTIKERIKNQLDNAKNIVSSKVKIDEKIEKIENQLDDAKNTTIEKLDDIKNYINENKEKIIAMYNPIKK